MKYSLAQVASIIGASAPELADEIVITGVSTDTRMLQRGALFFALSGGNYDGDAFVEEAFAKGAAGVVTHGVHESGPCLVVEYPLAALQQLAGEHRHRSNATVIAITGSCGKTTSKDMLAALLGSKHRVVKTQGNLNNDIGCP